MKRHSISTFCLHSVLTLCKLFNIFQGSRCTLNKTAYESFSEHWFHTGNVNRKKSDSHFNCESLFLINKCFIRRIKNVNSDVFPHGGFPHRSSNVSHTPRCANVFLFQSKAIPGARGTGGQGSKHAAGLQWQAKVQARTGGKRREGGVRPPTGAN